MPGTIVASTTPEQIEQYADEYVELLRKSNLPIDRAKIVSDMENRAAQANGQDVTAWRLTWQTNTANPPAPATPPTSGPTIAKPAGKREKLEEIDLVEIDLNKAERAKKERGQVTQIDPTYFHVPDDVMAGIKTWLALNESGVRMHAMAVGPAGCGKTSLFTQVLRDQFKLPVYKADCASITTPDRWLGHKDVVITQDGPQTTYVLSEFLRWVSGDGFEPGVVVLDELTRLPGYLLNIVNPILDSTEAVWVPELGIHIKVHPKTLFAATANIGAGFTGTYGLDQALQDRFGATFEMGFPSPAQEEKILVRRTGIEADKAKKLVQIAAQTRQKWDQGEIAKPVSTRALLNCAHWVATGRSIIDSAEATFVKQYSAEGKGQSERTIVQLILQGVAGKA